MPRTKDALSRYRIIDRELRRWRPLSSKKLASICSERLGVNISPRTIQKDIGDMKEDTSLNLNALILYDTKKKCHYYERGTPPLLFPSIELSEEETYALLFYTKATSHFKKYKIFSQISKAIKKVLDATNISDDLRKVFTTEAILETESLLPSKGIEMIKDLVLAVRQKRIIRFNYKRFEEDIEKERKLKPLLIKEYHEFWYVIGLLDHRDHPITFAIDRITNLVVTEETFDDVDFNAEEYFKYSYGITVPSDEPVVVVLSFTKQQGNYVKAVPIHEHQTVLVDNDQEFRISVKIKPSYEFHSKILSYGADVTVISPQEVVDHIKARISEALKNY
jgi:predicted DNA-binding transcriptional regulator YafY